MSSQKSRPLVLFIAEEALWLALAEAVVALTGAAAAVIIPALRTALTVARLGVEAGSKAVAGAVGAARREVRARIFAVRLTHVAPGANPRVPVPGRRIYERRIDVTKDLRPEEARAFGEGGQGSTKPDVDPPEQGPSGKSGATDADAEKKARQRQAGKDALADGKAGESFYNEKNGGRALQNKSGNGIDSVIDKPGEPLTFNEIKTSKRGDYRLSGEEVRGGRKFVRSRLTQISDQQGRYANISQIDADYAQELLDRIDGGESVEYNIVKLKKRADGGFVEDGNALAWNEDEEGFLQWRAREERKKRRRIERKKIQQDAQTPPSTGPPGALVR